jgi:hypothetical protein
MTQSDVIEIEKMDEPADALPEMTLEALPEKMRAAIAAPGGRR